MHLRQPPPVSLCAGNASAGAAAVAALAAHGSPGVPAWNSRTPHPISPTSPAHSLCPPRLQLLQRPRHHDPEPHGGPRWHRPHPAAPQGGRGSRRCGQGNRQGVGLQCHARGSVQTPVVLLCYPAVGPHAEQPRGRERCVHAFARSYTCSPRKPQGKERSRQRAARMLECHLAVLRMPTQPPAHPLTA